jgi:branched-chain amino acid transport system substrate-binding protein
MGKWMYKNTPHRTVVGTASDFLAGHHSVEAFKAGFEEAGGKVIKEVYPAVGTMDFASYLGAMDVKGADALYAFFAGTDAVRFVQQYQEFGLKKRLPLFGFISLVDEPYLDGMGDAAIGIVVVSTYPPDLDTPKNNAFIKSYKAKYGKSPDRYGALGYVAGNMIGATAEAMKGRVEDFPRVAKEMKRVASQIETPAGPLAFDQYNQRIVDEYVLKTEKRSGKLVNVTIDKLGMVAQEDVWKWWLK